MSKAQNGPAGIAAPVFGTVLRGIATTAGLSALLATTGYIAHFAQEDLLGVSLDSRATPAAFVLDGARFFTDLGMFLLRAAPAVIGALLVIALFLLLGAGVRHWLARAGRQPRTWARLPAWVLPSLLLGAVVGELAWNDLPTMYVQDVLFSPVKVGDEIELPQSLPRLLQHRTAALRNAIICSREPAAVPGCGVVSDPLRFLESWFSFNLVATVFLLVLGLKVLMAPTAGGSRAYGVAVFSPLGLILSLALLLNSLGIPFVYAKTVKPTRFLHVEIVFKKSEGAEKVEKSAAEEPPATSPASARTTTQTKVKDSPGASSPQPGAKDQKGVSDPPGDLRETFSRIPWFVLSESSEGLVLYRLGSTEIWSIPKADVQAIQIVEEGDVLGSYFLDWSQKHQRGEQR